MQQQLQLHEILMDFKVLSKYDDLFTDVFLDNLFLWFNTIKMNNDHRRPRVPNNKILDIIQRHILEKAKPMDAVNELLTMDYFKHYLAMKSQKQVQEFIQHMKRYLYMYMPNAGYEVGDTRRYGGNGRRVEACLVATKDWNTGDEMRLLTGMIACLDPKDDAELKKGNRDFSVMWSTRKNCSCLFLGPARFANHDCDSNCKFISLGQNSITFKVVKDIKCGEEITVYYGKHYFGENNNECRCITCEKRSMGHFATLETEEYSPIDMKEEDGGGTRRSTRKRKPALHEDPKTTSRRSKRASLEPRHSIDSLEELIGEEEKQDIIKLREEDKMQDVKKELDSLPPIPISPTTERMARLKVMSIDFLCGSDEEEEETKMQHIEKDRRVSDCPYLDLLVDAAVMDAEYSRKTKNPHQITVVVNPEIHRDAATRVYLQQQQQLQQQQANQKRKSLSSSPVDSGDSKADSAVSLSPRFMVNNIKKEEDDRCWRREMDDQLFSKELVEERAFDDFCDDVSDLSSVSSTELWTSDEEDNSTEDEVNSKSSLSKKKTAVKSTTSTTTVQELVCVACSKPLTKQEVSEQVGADMSITNELATWTWSPSAIFTDWRPKRCPRCERHFTIFKQEWPNRKIKNKKVPNKKKKKNNKLLAAKKQSLSQPSSPLPISKKVEDIPSTPIYQTMDDQEDSNYIPPSPLSEIAYDEDEIDTF